MMKRLAAMLTVILCLCAFAHAEETVGLTTPVPAAEETLITTVGEAKATADVDMAVISFRLTFEGETVDAANAQLTTAINSLTDSLMAQGLGQESIWRKVYDVSPNVVYHNTKMTSGEIVEGYSVEIVICVRLTDISLIGKVIDAATQSGAGGTHELQFERSQLPQAYQNALSQAAQLAMEKAQHLAQSCGMELGELVSVKELSMQADENAKVEVTYRAN